MKISFRIYDLGTAIFQAHEQIYEGYTWYDLKLNDDSITYESEGGEIILKLQGKKIKDEIEFKYLDLMKFLRRYVRQGPARELHNDPFFQFCASHLLSKLLMGEIERIE